MNESKQSQGKTREAFNASAKPASAVSEQTPRGSEMVKQSKLSLNEGPRPPALGHTMRRVEFNRRWREEGRMAKAVRAVQKACTARDRKVELKETRLRKNFNRQSGIDNGRGR